MVTLHCEVLHYWSIIITCDYIKCSKCSFTFLTIKIVCLYFVFQIISLLCVIRGNVKVANFLFLKKINQFDFEFQPSIDKQKIMDLMTLRFLEKAENIIFCGSPGVGKTNLAVSIGIEAAKQRNCVYFITFQELMSQLKKLAMKTD